MPWRATHASTTWRCQRHPGHDQFLTDLGVQATLREEAGTVPAIAGMLRAPLDILADKLRGYVGLVDDLCERPRKVLAACEALMPHLAHFALATADPQQHVPLGFWMHRGCVPFVSFDQFHELFWATLKPIVQELWAHGHQTCSMPRATGIITWRRLPSCPSGASYFTSIRATRSKPSAYLGRPILFERGDSELAAGQWLTRTSAASTVRKILRTIGSDGGYILDASAIIQNDGARGKSAAHDRGRRPSTALFARATPTEPLRPPHRDCAPADERPPRRPRADRRRSAALGQRPPGRVRAVVRGDGRVWGTIRGRIRSAGTWPDMYIWTLFLVF